MVSKFGKGSELATIYVFVSVNNYQDEFVCKYEYCLGDWNEQKGLNNSYLFIYKGYNINY